MASETKEDINMKKNLIKTIGVVAGLALSLSLFTACNPNQPNNQLDYDNSVVKAFRAVNPSGDLVSQTAVAEDHDYLVTVITSTAVSEYHVGSDFQVGSSTAILGETPVAASLAAESSGDALSDLERAFEEALALSGIAKVDIVGFDFDKDTYMGTAVFKVEIEDAVAEYTYILKADDFSLIESKTELKNSASGGEASSYIGEERAKAIALDAVGVSEDMTANFTLRSLLDHGKKLYAVNFDYDGFRYTIEIDALNGSIVKFSKGVLDESVAKPEIPSSITEEQAKQIALDFAFPEGVGDRQVSFRKVKLDYEHGIFLYEVEFVAENCEYEFEIAASDGTILDVEIDAGASHGHDAPPQTDRFISREEAVAIALDKAGADALLIEVDVEREYVNGEVRYFYEVEVKVGGRELEYLVDAITGEVVLNEDYTGNPVNPAPTTEITEEEALAIALDDFGLTEDALSAKKIKLEREDGRLCYEIKLYADGVEYSMEVDAQTGKILEREIDREHDAELPPQSPSDPPASGYISRDQAIQAVKDALSGKNVRVKDAELDDEGTGADKRFYWEVEVVVDGREYDYYVDALTGEVHLKGELIGGGQELIGEERARSIALDFFSLTEKEARVIKVKLEEDDGILIYEVEIEVRDLEYSIEIDAATGTILEHDISYD